MDKYELIKKILSNPVYSKESRLYIMLEEALRKMSVSNLSALLTIIELKK